LRSRDARARRGVGARGDEGARGASPRGFRVDVAAPTRARGGDVDDTVGADAR